MQMLLYHFEREGWGESKSNMSLALHVFFQGKLSLNHLP
jgi:hypothetical protein